MATLLTLDTYKQAKGITSAKEDERLGIIISSVSSLVKTYCNNSLVDYITDPYTEYLTPEFSISEVILTEFPVVSISEVWIRTHPTEDYEQLLDDGTDYVLNRRTDSLVRVDALWPIGVEAIKAVYTAGYSSTPPDLTLALVDLTSYYYKEEHKITKQLGSASINNPSGTLQGNVGFPDHIKRVLDLYRQI